MRLVRWIRFLPLLLLAKGAALAQIDRTLTDGSTPPGIAAGSPAGSYALSGFDTINLFNGRINFALPLIEVAGRGQARYTMHLKIDRRWTIQETRSCPTCPPVSDVHDAWWSGDPGYGPGQLIGRYARSWLTCSSGSAFDIFHTLSRLTFIGPDGTEYELRDQESGGQSKPNPYWCQFPSGPPPGFDRKKVFTSADGTAMTFVSDTNITDTLDDFTDQFFPTGTLMLRDGTRYRIEGGLVMTIRDRNGNLLKFEYEPSGAPLQRVKKITDSLNRTVTIDYGDTTAVDVITFKRGVTGQVIRTIRVGSTALSAALRPGFQIQTIQQLFGNDLQINNTDPHDPPRVTAWVELPNLKTYNFQYNSYGELARVELPTGGAFEYDWGSGFSLSQSGAYSSIMVYRRVNERRACRETADQNSTFACKGSQTDSRTEQKTLYSSSDYNVGGPPNVVVTVDHRDPTTNQSLTVEKHSFSSNALSSAAQQPLDYAPWQTGRELQADELEGTTAVRSAIHTWQQRAAVPWYTGLPQFSPALDPRIIQTDTWLVGSGQSRQTFTYDQYNNKMQVCEYDFGPVLKRCTLTNYKTDTYDTLVPNSVEPDLALTAHIRDLPSEQIVYEGGTTQVARTTTDYDIYGEPLTHRDSLSGHDPLFIATYTRRGNATAVSRWLKDDAGAWTALTTRQEYDIAGNVVKRTEPRSSSYVTRFFYDDNFGSPADYDARTNMHPAELKPPLNPTTQFAFAFPTKIENALGHTSYTQYDYYYGKVVSIEDANGIITNIATFADSLDRPRQIQRAAGIDAFRNLTDFDYDDDALQVVTATDWVTFGDGMMKSEVLYDSLGRQIKTRTHEDTGFWTARYIEVEQTYDAMGRVKQVSNPRRWVPGNPPTTTDPLEWTTTEYDALGRVKQAIFPDGSIITTDYSGAETTVTDPAGKKRKSKTDALGRLVEVVEDPGSSPHLNLMTIYAYDALNNLTKVTQGAQIRTFGYDSLSRLICASNPESRAATAPQCDASPMPASGLLRYEYDNNGNLVKRTDARGVITCFGTLTGSACSADGYDLLNRVTTKTYSDGTPAVTYAYDQGANGKGRLNSVAAAGVSSTSFTYDPLGRIPSSQQTTGGINYPFAYELHRGGQMKTQTYPSGKLVGAFLYDQAGKVTDVNGYAASMAYTPHGGLKEMRLANLLWETTQFNNRLQPVMIALGTAHNSPPQASDWDMLKLEYFYRVDTQQCPSGTSNNNGNVQCQNITVPDLMISGLKQRYSYDPLNRLQTASETGNGDWLQTYAYDQYGNRWINLSASSGLVLSGHTPLGDATSSDWVDSATNRLAAGKGFNYDAAGNQTQDPGPQDLHVRCREPDDLGQHHDRRGDVHEPVPLRRRGPPCEKSGGR